MVTTNNLNISLPNSDDYPDFSDLNLPTVINTDVSLLRVAQVTNINLQNNTIDIFVLTDNQTHTVEYPSYMSDWNKKIGFWHGLSKGDLVLCIVGYGNKFVVLNKIGNPTTNEQLNGFSSSPPTSLYIDSAGAEDVDFKNISPGDFLIKAENNTKLNLSKQGVVLGNKGKGSLTFDTTDINASQSGTTVLESNQKYEFSNSGYSIEGIVLRDRRIKDINGDTDQVVNSRIIFQWYKDLQQVTFDPSLSQVFEKTDDTHPRNPAFVEQKNVIFEFSDYNYDDPIESDQKEATKQSVDTNRKRNPAVSRRARKNDDFNLSLISPNYFIEEIKGTAIDALGNIIDLNRTILPIGDPNGIVKLEGNSESYYKVRELHRKGIAFHWELNARKNKESSKSAETKTKNEYGKVDDVYKRNRSRFFLDIDKEGQLKLNVPSSSETGNISVLARYENYTNVFPNEKTGDNDYDYFSRTEKTDVDILLDSFGKGVANLTGNSKLLPKDRITNTAIKLGTMYHDISTTCVTPMKTKVSGKWVGYGILSGPDTMIEPMDGANIYDILKNTITDTDPANRTIISKTINIEGTKANAGGRSATLNFEGMINTSIGANTIDRQSLWLDTQGGIVSRIGADKNGISMATQTDGDIYWQIGGEPLGTDPDTRFKDNKINDRALKTNRFEVRVMQGNGPSFTRILIDNRGLIITSPQDIEFRSEQSILLFAQANIHLSCERLYTHDKDANNNDDRPSVQNRNKEDFYNVDVGGRVVQRGLEYQNV